MDAVTYIRERARMCLAYSCDECPLKGYPDCYNPEDASGAVATVEKWGKDHPPVTNGGELMRSLPVEAIVDDERMDEVTIRVPRKWWDAEYKGEWHE